MPVSVSNQKTTSLDEAVVRRLAGRSLPPTAALALPSVPQAPGSNPFDELPFPSPGERIKADDFKKLSQSLRIIYEASVLSAALFGRTFGQAKLALTMQQYEIRGVMSVFGAELDNSADTLLDDRKVIQIVPTALGEHQVMIVVTEAVDTRRFAPNLIGVTYKEASERLKALLGDVQYSGAPINAPQLIGFSLAQAEESLSK